MVKKSQNKYNKCIVVIHKIQLSFLSLEIIIITTYYLDYYTIYYVLNKKNSKRKK
jgi:hypothetical protein